MENPVTLTIDLVDSGALSLLRDMERRNLIRVNPPAGGATEIAAAEKKTLPDRGTAEKEMNRIRKLVEGMDYQPPSCDIADSLKEAIRRASTEADAREYRRMLDMLPVIFEILDNDEGVRSQRKIRAEWDGLRRDYDEPAAAHV
jgi:hypothetical protein